MRLYRPVLTDKPRRSRADGKPRRLALPACESSQPTDWSDLTIYGMYAVEAAILAAAAHLDQSVGRKAAAYGDEDIPDEFDNAEDLANEIEQFVDAIDAFMAGGKP